MEGLVKIVNIPDGKFIFYNTKPRFTKDAPFNLVKREDFNPKYMEWVVKPSQPGELQIEDNKNKKTK